MEGLGGVWEATGNFCFLLGGVEISFHHLGSAVMRLQPPPPQRFSLIAHLRGKSGRADAPAKPGRGTCVWVGVGGWGWGQDKQVCWGVPPGPVSDPPSLGGVGSAGGAIASPWALCNYALT